MNYKGRRVLVTGATGFIGGRLAERLAFEHGAEVRALVHNVRHAVRPSRLPAALIEGDVARRETLDMAMAGCEVVFHCAAAGGSPEICQRVNVEGTKTVLEAASDAAVARVVYLSSIAVHGPRLPEKTDETAPLVRTGDPYGDSKIAAEEMITAFTRERSIPIVVLRPTQVWGPCSEWYTIDPVRQIRAGTWRLVDRGRGSCHAVYVDNLVDAILLAGQSLSAAGETFIITDDQPCSWREFYLEYARMLGVPSVRSISAARGLNPLLRRVDRALDRGHRGLEERLPAAEPFRFCARAARYALRHGRRLLKLGPFGEWDLIRYARSHSVDLSKARSLLGYRPSFTRKEGMRLTELWLRDQRIIPSQLGGTASKGVDTSLVREFG